MLLRLITYYVFSPTGYTLDDNMLDEAIDNIPFSTRKRKLFDSKSLLTEYSNIPSVSINR